MAKWPSPTPRAAPVAVTTDNAGPVAVKAVLQNLAATMAAATAAAVTAQRFAGLVVRRRKKSRKRREWRQRKARIRKERAAVAAAVAGAQEQSGTAVLRVDAAVAAPAAVGAPGLVRSLEEARFACFGSPRRLGYHHPGCTHCDWRQNGAIDAAQAAAVSPEAVVEWLLQWQRQLAVFSQQLHVTQQRATDAEAAVLSAV